MNMTVILALLSVLIVGLGFTGFSLAPRSEGGGSAARTPVASGALSPRSSPSASVEYPVHSGIKTTIFWVGEGANASNDFIQNRSSAWATDWVGAYGGVDNPDNRCGYYPCAFTPKENPFYFALPFGDYTENGLKPASRLRVIPWYDPSVAEGDSLLKNHWIEIKHGEKTAYAQWEDVGPFEEDDATYVFGTSQPKEPRAGLDISPATASYLGIDGRGVTSWRFVSKEQVAAGPWQEIVTTSKPNFQ